MATLSSVCSTIQTAVGGVTGIKSKPDYPTESMHTSPYIVTYPESYTGSMNTTEDFKMIYNITVELHISRQNLPTDVERLMAFAESVPNAIFKALRDNQIAASGITGAFAGMQWGDTQTIGYRWTIQNVKILTTIT
jgi:hypothetical protein